nr:alpha/beta hydrolase-fold protein [Verrucomicrobium spinosum]
MNLVRTLDNLIAQKRVPAMIAIMISSGGGDAQGHERGREYDTMSRLYAEFIETEVLPLVEKNYGVKLTKDPEGRATMGNSSGGSAALAMAWYRTDLYHRVITTSGTFVNQQWPFNPETPGGAWDFHDKLIPASPVKPLRIWMAVGDRDLLNPNVMRDNMHDWVEANHRMAKVLKAKVPVSICLLPKHRPQRRTSQSAVFTSGAGVVVAGVSGGEVEGWGMGRLARAPNGSNPIRKLFGHNFGCDRQTFLEDCL